MKRILSLSALMVCSLLVAAQSVLSLSVDDRLSDNTVSSFCEDALGRIWMATKVGVDRFDGYDIDVFYHDPFNDKSVQSNLINKVYCDRNGNVWICNASGLAMYDSSVDEILRVDIPLRSVENIVQVTDSRYLICSQSSSLLYDSETGTCEPFENFVFYNVQAWGGCFVFCTSAHNLDFISFAEDGTWSRKSEPIHFPGPVHGVVFDSDGNIWADAEGSGLWKIDPVSFGMTLVGVEGLPTARIECLCSDTEGRFWLGTKRGIRVFDPSDGSSLSASQVAPGLLPYESLEVRTFFKDSRSDIWVGTNYVGAICRPSAQKSFAVVHFPDADVSVGMVTSLDADPSDSTLWVGTQRSGVYKINKVSHIPVSVSDINAANSVCFHPSYPSSVFVSTFTGGVYSIDKVNGNSHPVYKKSDIQLVHPAVGGKLWVGGLSGLYLVDPVSGTAMNPKLFTDNSRHSVTALLTDMDGLLWVGCREGLYRCVVDDDGSLEDMSRKEMFDIMRVQALCQTCDKTVWIGTCDGLMSFSGGELKGFVSEPAFKGRSVTGILEDDAGNLWITTNHGLFCYNYKAGTCAAYYSSDGLYSDNFTTGCIGCSGNDFYVGSRGGLSLFHPELMSRDTVTVTPFVSRLLVHNLPVSPNDGSGILEAPIGETDKMVIRHNQNAFSFQFACPDFAAGGNNVFWYMMEGFDEDWIQSANRTATYTNLPKGNYVFRVRAANTSGQLCPDEVAISVRVRPVWYKTDAFLAFLLLLGAFGILYLIDFMVGRANARNEVKMAEMKESYEVQLRHAKLREYIVQGYVPTADEENMLLKFIAKIEESVSDSELSVESLASFMCMSRCNLHLKVKNMTGVSPIDIVRKIRIEKACELLRQGNLQLVDVAEQSGFSSTSYFCSSFKKATGHTPKEYMSGK